MSSNFGLTTFAEDGKLAQVTNAIQASDNGETSIGIITNSNLLYLHSNENERRSYSCM